MANIKTKNWSVIDAAPEEHKNTLIKNIVNQNPIHHIDTIKGWISFEELNYISEIRYLYHAIKNIDNSIVLYKNINTRSIEEFVVTSSKFTKDIYNTLVKLVLDYEDITGRELEYYYLSDDEMRQTDTFSDFEEIEVR